MINDLLEEIQKVIESFDENIQGESNAGEFIKQGKLEIVTHDDICFEFTINSIEDGTLEKVVSVSKLKENDHGGSLSNLIPQSNLLN
tara:strand:+ start:138 stop:398 length:261 start_codon:yes stop_codon:yes gene_type:complete